MGEQLAADATVQLRHTVGAGRRAQAEHGHVELRRFLARIAAELEQVGDREPPRIGPRLQVLGGDVAREAVDAGGHRGVGREHELAADLPHGLFERFAVGDAAVEQLEDQEPGVSLVEVEDPG